MSFPRSLRSRPASRDSENSVTIQLMVGLSGLEPPTSRLSGVRSNRLSYKPISWFERWFPTRPLVFPASAIAVRRTGGDERVRTDDPLLAKQVLSQLSYTPIFSFEYQAIFSCARPYSPEVPFYRALKIKQRSTSQTIS